MECGSASWVRDPWAGGVRPPTSAASRRSSRASNLVVTERGEATAEAMRRERSEHLRIVTDGWEEQEVAQLARLLHRLAADVDARTPAVVAPR